MGVHSVIQGGGQRCLALAQQPTAASRRSSMTAAQAAAASSNLFLLSLLLVLLLPPVRVWLHLWAVGSPPLKSLGCRLRCRLEPVRGDEQPAAKE